MDKSETIANLALALSKAQGEIKGALINAVGYQNNKYADLGAVTEAIKIPLAKNELSYVQLVSSENGIGVETVLMHSSGEWLSSLITLPFGEGEKGRTMAQNAGAIITYLRRYGLSAMLGIYADEDTDGNEKKGSKPEKASPPPPTSQSPEPEPLLTVTLDTAMAVKGTDGIPYGEVDSDKLNYKRQSLRKSLQDRTLTLDDKELRAFKIAAIDTILASRK